MVSLNHRGYTLVNKNSFPEINISMVMRVSSLSKEVKFVINLGLCVVIHRGGGVLGRGGGGLSFEQVKTPLSHLEIYVGVIQ